MVSGAGQVIVERVDQRPAAQAQEAREVELRASLAGRSGGAERASLGRSELIEQALQRGDRLARIGAASAGR